MGSSGRTEDRSILAPVARAAIAVVALATLAGCQPQGGLVPVARMSQPAILELRLRPAAVPTGKHAAVLPLPRVAVGLDVDIGEPGAPEFRQARLSIGGPPGEVREATVPGLPPGSRRRVRFRVRDVGGGVVFQGGFFVDLYPGAITSEYIDMDAGMVLSSIVPDNGPQFGGTSVTLTGANFNDITGVTFGGVPAAGIQVESPTTIRCVTPSSPVTGVVPVVVSSSSFGTATLPAGFTYTLVSWARTYGGPGNDGGYLVDARQTSDGGHVLGGDTISFGAGGRDIWLLKLDPQGNVVWQKAYGGPGSENLFGVDQTADGGFVVAGETNSFGAGGADALILKLDGAGNIVWQRTYGGADPDWAEDVHQTSDGGYIVAGATSPFGPGASVFWVLKLDAQGNIVWQNRYGIGGERPQTVEQTPDGGYIVAGTSATGDLWLLKLDPFGAIVWQNRYGGAGIDRGGWVRTTADGGYVVASFTNSFGAGSNDVWVLKLDASGSVVWQRTYGGSGNERTAVVDQTSDGGYVVGSTADSFAGAWVLRLDAQGNVLWQRVYAGGTVHAMHRSSDDGFIFAGPTMTYGAGSNDVWLVKLDPEGRCPPLGADTNAVVTVTTVIPQSTAVLPVPTTCTVSSPAVTVTATNGVVQQQAP